MSWKGDEWTKQSLDSDIMMVADRNLLYRMSRGGTVPPLYRKKRNTRMRAWNTNQVSIFCLGIC